MKPAQRPIAVFDSGVGGLTVFRALRRLLPRERLIYFGDTARLPYGSKSREAVARCALEVASFLRKRDIKMLVVACNSASALALPELQAALDIPVVGVLAPAARAAVAASRSGRIGVIGTEATILSGAYQRALLALAPWARVAARACPLFVPLVEEGWWRHPVTARVAREYLRPLLDARVDALILGCTHYPLLRPLLARLLGPRVRLIDSARETAREVRALLDASGLRRARGEGKASFFVSDAPKRFRKLARRVFGGAEISVRLVSLEELEGGR